MTRSSRKAIRRSPPQAADTACRDAGDRRHDILRQVIPIASHQQASAETGRDYRGILAGVTLIVLHLASAALALAYF